MINNLIVLVHCDERAHTRTKPGRLDGSRIVSHVNNQYFSYGAIGHERAARQPVDTPMLEHQYGVCFGGRTDVCMSARVADMI